jgi:hypothetical protein
VTDLILTWRSALRGLLPRWLLGKHTVDNDDPNAGFWGTRLHYGIGVVQDDIGTAFHLGLQSSFPGLGDETALALTGQARGILRGPSESSAAYASRLRFWRQSRRRKGNAFALMEQLQAYLQPFNVTIRIQYDNGVRYQLAPGGYLVGPQGYQGTSFATFSTVAWNWDGATVPTRFWVILEGELGAVPMFSSDGTWATSGLWNDRNTDDGTYDGTNLDSLAGSDTTPTYGSTASYSVVQGLLALIEEWTPPHAQFVCAIYAFDGTTFGDLSPDGTWANAGNRSQNYVYWEL